MTELRLFSRLHYVTPPLLQPSLFLQEFERFQSAGLIKHLGVSNFNERQVQRLLDNSLVKPEVLQVSKSQRNCPLERKLPEIIALSYLVLSATKPLCNF